MSETNSMKVMVFNNTSRYHNGCKKVMQYIHHDIRKGGHILTESVFGNCQDINYNQSNFDDADLVIVNGEGTMHHDKKTALDLIDMLSYAQREGKKTMLINTVWQEMTPSPSVVKTLRNCDYVSVREVKSQRQMHNMDVDADVNIDLSYFVHVSPKKYKRSGTVIGRFFDKREINSKQHVHLNIFKQEWEEIVNILRWSDCFITGRHHEMYAACKARCPFVVVEGNTWKNSGLMETAGVDIPVFTYEATNGQLMQGVDLMMEYADQFETLFNWMQKQPAPNFCNIIANA